MVKLGLKHYAWLIYCTWLTYRVWLNSTYMNTNVKAPNTLKAHFD